MSLLTYIGTFAVAWIVATILHELGHWIGAYLTGGRAKIKIWFWKGIPSMMAVPSGNYNRRTFLFMGGFFTGIIYLFSSMIANNTELLFSLWTIAWIHLIYALYETNYRDLVPLNMYMLWHYVLYLVVGGFWTLTFYVMGVIP